MKPHCFDSVNVVFGKEQPEYIPLPGRTWLDSDGTAVTTLCWKLSLFERVYLLFTGKIWQDVLTFNGPLQPQRFHIKHPEGF